MTLTQTILILRSEQLELPLQKILLPYGALVLYKAEFALTLLNSNWRIFTCSCTRTEELRALLTIPQPSEKLNVLLYSFFFFELDPPSTCT